MVGGRIRVRNRARVRVRAVRSKLMPKLDPIRLPQANLGLTSHLFDPNLNPFLNDNCNADPPPNK